VSTRSAAACGELRAAARLLGAEPARPIPRALAKLLNAQAAYWDKWFPASPTATDLAFVEVARAIQARYTKPPAADAGKPPAKPTTEGMSK
jgi:hypothetical protein